MCSRNFNAPGSPFYEAGGDGPTSSSNKYRSEDIMSCISALDEVIAEFDDPSLSYIYEDDCSNNSAPGTPSQSQIVPSSSGETTKYFSGEDQLVLKNEKANHATPHKVLNQPVSESNSSSSNSKSSPPSRQSHLIQIPVFSSAKASKASSSKQSSKSEGTGVSSIQMQPISKEKVISPSSSSTSTPSSLSSKLPGRPSVVPQTCSDTSPNLKVSKSGSSSNGGGVCGGTYSKGTMSSQEILLLPRIPSCSSDNKSSVGSSSSSRKHVQQEPIYSSVGKSRPQLSLGMYTSSEPDAGGHHHRHLFPPQEPEVDYNDETTHDVTRTNAAAAAGLYNANNDHNHHEKPFSSSGGSGRLSKSSSSSGAATSAMGCLASSPSTQLTKELWNFPSEKNLPRSLRKTRNTCFLDDNSMGEKSEGKLNNESDSEARSIGGHSSASEDLHPNSRHHHQHNNNGRNSTKMDDKQKIYEEIAEIISSNKGQQHKGAAAVDSFERASSSSSNSFTFNSFNNNSTSPGADPQLVNAPMPKPRVRQQIPKEDGLSPVKYPPPPGKIPKPNPKPVAGTNQTEPSSPFSPLQCEITRTGDEVVVDVSKAGIFHETTNEMKHSVKNSRLKNNNLNNGSSPTTTTSTTPTATATQNHNNGHMMRMMMMNPSSKNNSTGSASSISRSSSSSSGGDPNYYRKDNLSSSSGVVVTTNSSITTGSPTHSVNNNSLTLNNNNNNTNNNVTIIHSEKCGSEGGSSVSMMVKATPQTKQQLHSQRGAGQQQQQRGHPGIGKKASSTPVGACHQVKHITAKPTTTVVLTNGVLEVDDGYLSMINRNEAPLLWPEEFIENETFSPDELKRLSVHLPEEDEDEDSSSPDSDSCSEEKEIELEIVDYDREPSRRQPNHHNPSLKSSAGCGSKARRQMSEKKTDYFSDDSLEGDREEDLANFHHKKARGKSSSVSPYLYHGDGGGYHNAGNLHSTNSTPNHRPYYRQQITVNTAVTPMVRGQVSRIPKMINGTKPNKGGGKSSSPDTPVKLPKRKPCSFFVSLTDEGCSEVNSPITNNKSSSLPMGAKVAVSPIKSSAAKVNQSATATPSSSNVQIIESKSTTAETNNNSNRGGEGFTNNTTAPQVIVNSNLPQLRHTKSINTGGPRHFSSNVNNANKRKSTSDLVTVVALNNNHDATDIPPTQPPTNATTVNTGGSVNSTSVFNRTSTFLIPSPISRTGHDELNANQLKRPRDDETDNDEDDFSSDFDILSSTDPEPLDSLQPLSLTDVNDFVSEIMDTALRQEIKRTQMVLNNYPPTDIDSSTNSQLIADKSQQAVLEQLPLEHHQRNATQQPSSQSPQQEKRKSSSVPAVAVKKEEATLCCDNDDQPAVENLPEDREERARVALQLEAVVSTFLSDNQSFLGRGESEDGDLDVDAHVQHVVAGGRNECDDKNSSKGEVVEISHLKPNHGESLDHFNDKKDEEQKVDEMNKTDIKVCSDAPPIDKDFLQKGTVQPLMNSIPKSTGSGGGGCGSSNNSAIRDSSLVGEEKILDVEESDEEEDSAEEQPPEFIPTPPPHLLSPPPIPIAPVVVSTIPQHKNLQPGFINTNGNLHNLHNSNVRDGKAALDILAERINNSKKFSNPDDQIQVSQFIHDKRNIWAMYDRPFDEDLLTVNNPGVRGYASRSQENLMDAMTKERFQKSFNSRGQSSTLPLNCRPPTSGGQRRSSTFRNMFSKFRRNKQPAGQVIKELPEYRDDEVQSITSRETGPSEQGKKRGFFSRLFRRSRKH
ncbi:probable serine/threonine-protein kinase DDB_G0282963 isoform X2 [Folsomia candida]|uniref:probable serine/threonine-protein kinase DDB_G0282963 isoform X2 n=1 Tax=Folsomia candida TaxID=158441 RepID=UPI001604D391|nr:probable serine/threonine-protein kinase DDB_G0282963 isoform X2 [Folsomia candida]